MGKPVLFSELLRLEVVYNGGDIAGALITVTYQDGRRATVQHTTLQDAMAAVVANFTRVLNISAEDAQTAAQVLAEAERILRQAGKKGGD